MAGDLPVYVVETSIYKDWNKEAVHAAVSDAQMNPATLLFVLPLTEVPTSRGTDLPASEVDTRTAMEHGRRMIEALVKPMLTYAKANNVPCNAVVERNDVRERGVCSAARRAHADRVYVCLKKKLLGFASSPASLASPWLSLLPPSITLVVLQSGKKPEALNGRGPDAPDFPITVSPFISCKYSSAPKPSVSKSSSSIQGGSGSGSFDPSRSYGSSPARSDSGKLGSGDLSFSPYLDHGSGRKGGSSNGREGAPKSRHGLVPGAVYTAEVADATTVGAPLSPVSNHSIELEGSPSNRAPQQAHEFSGLAASLLGSAIEGHSSSPIVGLPRGSSLSGSSTVLTQSLPTVPEGILDDVFDRSNLVNKSAPHPRGAYGEEGSGEQYGAQAGRKNPLAAELALLEEDEDEGEEKEDVLGGKVTSNRPAGSPDSYQPADSHSQGLLDTSSLSAAMLSGAISANMSANMTNPNHTGPMAMGAVDISTELPITGATRFKDFSSSRFSNSRISNHMFGQAQHSGGMAVAQGRFSVGADGAIVAMGDGYDCRLFTSKQLEKATMGYARGNLLGRGSFGQVFKGEMLGCKVAIKKLEGSGWQGPEEFRMEVEVLSRMRHPNIVLLMGCSLEEHALVYEFLSGGTLQDKLGSSKGDVPLGWSDRLRITAEISSALLYLHQNDPPIVHRDLKPDNILLDGHLISKIGDVGLARLLVEDDSMTVKVRGTAGYIDPEEVETCEISVKSDIYALGLIMLQLLTGQRMVKSVHRMLTECAGAKMSAAAGAAAPDQELDGVPPALVPAVRVVMKYLDSRAGEWRKDLAARTVALALQCAERRREARPDLGDEIHPELVRISEEAAEEEKRRKKSIDSQFICPLSKEIMQDPVVAADGFTYERAHITKWMENCTLSPSTGLPFAHMCLTPNIALKTLLQSHQFL